MSDLETSSSGAKAQTLRCDYEGPSSPLVIGLSGRWDPQIVMDCQWAPLGPARVSLLLLPHRFDTPTIESRSLSECRGTVWVVVGWG